MTTDNRTAKLVGILYIIGTVAGILSVVFTGPVVAGSDVLANVSAHQNQILLGALFVLIMGFALALVPVMMFPILKKYNEALALGYVVFRGALETVMYIVLAISWIFLIPLSNEYVKAGTPDTSYLQTLGTLVPRRTRLDWSCSRDRLLSGCPDFLLFIVSDKPHSPVVIGVGSHCNHTLFSCRFASFVRFLWSSLNERDCSRVSIGPAGNGYGGLADCERIQPVFNRFRVCYRRIKRNGEKNGKEWK